MNAMHKYINFVATQSRNVVGLYFIAVETKKNAMMVVKGYYHMVALSWVYRQRHSDIHICRHMNID